MSEANIPELIVPGEMSTAIEPAQAATPSALELASLSPAEQEAVKAFTAKVDITDSTVLVQYGAPAQSKIATFSDSLLKNMKTKDAGEVGKLLSDLVVEIKGFDASATEKKGLFQSVKGQIEKMMSNYSKVNVNIEKIVDVLEGHKRQLLKDITVFDGLMQSNAEYCKEVTMYIIAGKEKLREINEVSIPALKKKAEETGDQTDLQALTDMQDFADRFDKKISDLMTTRIISIQMAPQIRLLQHNDTLLSDKIQSTLMNAIPLWKNQVIIALGLQNAKLALGAQQKVTDMTNELLKKNSEMLKQGSIEIAKANERAIVDIETLQKTNSDLITTISEVLRIQDEGRTKRQQSEVEMVKIEAELKAAVLNSAK